MRNKNAKVSDPNKFVTSAGDRFHITYAAKVEPDGLISLAPSGKEDIQEYINSFRDSTDMNFILNRLAVGDTSVLNQKQAIFGDFTKLPKTYAETLQLVIDAEHNFYELPLDVRNKFDNNYQKWFATAGSQFWLDAMGITSEPAAVKVSESESEVSE